MARILKLIAYPDSYNENWCLIHPDCEDELREIADKSGNLRKLRSNFKTRMQYLKVHRENAVQHDEWFEKLSHEKDLYSLHIATVNNLRILYALRDDQVWLLCAFAEKDRAKRASYRRYIPVAQKRLEEIIKGDKND